MLRPTLDDAILIGYIYKQTFFPDTPRKPKQKKRKGPHPRKGARRKRRRKKK